MNQNVTCALPVNDTDARSAVFFFFHTDVLVPRFMFSQFITTSSIILSTSTINRRIRNRKYQDEAIVDNNSAKKNSHIGNIICVNTLAVRRRIQVFGNGYSFGRCPIGSSDKTNETIVTNTTRQNRHNECCYRHSF